MKRNVLLMMFAASVAVSAAGCGSDRVPTYPVSGRLTVNGKPPPEGWIAILHLEPAPDPKEKYPHPVPRARVEPNGRFQFHTYERDDGAPAGNYKISFVDVKTSERQSATKDEPEGNKNTMNSKKSSQVYWPAPIEIRPEPNELPSFDLK